MVSVFVKRCSGCKELLGRDDFSGNALSKDGLQSRCRSCHYAGSVAARRSTRRGEVVATRVCVVCGKTFDAVRRAGRPPVVCSAECRSVRLRAARPRRVYVRRVREERVCVVCSQKFLAASKKSAVCKSSSCVARYYLLRRYGLSADDWRAMMGSQNNVCAGCGDRFGSRGPQIDHCHETGRVRGLLCTSCNLALGHTKDDVARLHRLVAYLDAA
jgi:hypothetical protein